MYKTEPLSQIPVHPARPWSALVLAAGLCAAAQAQPRPPAAPPVATPAVAAAAPTVAELGTAGPDSAEQLNSTANLIARLRQQQAVVEAQAALAKANAELVRINQSAAPAPVVGTPLPAGALGLPVPRQNLRLLGVSGAPERRIATLEMPDGVVRDASVGSQVGSWRVQEIGLSEVVLVPRGRAGGSQVTLRADTAPQEQPVTAAERGRRP